jgi:hypothetical protein
MFSSLFYVTYGLIITALAESNSITGLSDYISVNQAGNLHGLKAFRHPHGNAAGAACQGDAKIYFAAQLACPPRVNGWRKALRP